MINNSLFRPSVLNAARRKFNPEGFDLAQALLKKDEPEKFSYPEDKPFGSGHIDAFADVQPQELVDYSSDAERKQIVAAAYKQVFGNAYLMESERDAIAESKVRDGSLSVMEFVRALAKSDRYRALFFEKCTNVRTVELNFKHLLGRAPNSQAEISEHIQILVNQGFEAEIDSYLDSDEYSQNFGTSIVPYYRGYKSQTGKNLAGYTHSFQLIRGASSSDKSLANGMAPQIQTPLAKGEATDINPLSCTPSSFKGFDPLQPPDLQTGDRYEYREVPIAHPQYKTKDFLAKPVSPNTWLQEFNARKAAASFPAARRSQPTKLFNGASGEEAEIVIRAAYKQVFGNAHLMEHERCITAESQLKGGEISVQDFIRALAKSETYRRRFLEECTNVRFIELNFKHLLGRAPDSGAEVSEHIIKFVENGFDAEIDSYIDSAEYKENFGTDTVPYYVAYSTQTGKNGVGYNRIFKLTKSESDSDRTIGLAVSDSKGSQLQKSLLTKKNVELKTPIPFNTGGFDLAKAVAEAATKPSATVAAPTEIAKPVVILPSVASRYVDAYADLPTVELLPTDSDEKKTQVIAAVYKQVFGNAYLMESERYPQLESQLRNGEINVSGFVRALAKSDRYRKLFLEGGNNVKAIELNFKHLLGRAPEGQGEISEHIQILVEQGYEAEIDSYIDSEEYVTTYGASIVPYWRGYKSQTGKTLASYTNAFKLTRGASGSDKSNSELSFLDLARAVLSDRPNAISSIKATIPTRDLIRAAIRGM